MRVLWVATKAPWPTVDGGRLLLWNTLRALRRAGEVEVTLVAPYLGDPSAVEECAARLAEVCRPVLVRSRLRPAGVDLLQCELRRRPWTLVRHRNAEVRRRVAEELVRGESGSFDLVVAEQVQALSQIPTSATSGTVPPVTRPPVILRAQNVESDLWRGQSTLPGVPAAMRWWLRRQAGRLARAEGEAVRRCAATAALTEYDAGAFRRLAGEDADQRVRVIPAVVDEELAAGPALDGSPALVLFGSAGWRPNADGARWFLADAWPGIRQRLPGAVLHLFGDPPIPGSEGMRRHPAPADSATALAQGSILVVPLGVASGVRMKILEAWARGVPVVASQVAARGLEAEPGRELQIAQTPADWADAVARAAERREEQVAAARQRLRETYGPAAVRRRWLPCFAELASVGDSARFGPAQP